MLPTAAASTPHLPVLLVTGLASPGKTRFVDALLGRLDPRDIAVRTSRDAGEVVLHVHAETDLESMVEGGWLLPDASDAQLKVAVDWEPIERSVRRVIEALAAGRQAWKGAA